MVARLRLFDCQKLLSQSFQQTAELYLGRLPSSLEKYSLEYFQELRTYQKISRKSSILDEVLSAQIVLCGDYHSSSQAQRTVIRILREILPRLKKERKTLYLGLEALRVRDNIRVEQFLRGEIPELKFLKSVAFEDWGFSWNNYAPLFELAKKEGISIVGLSPNRSSSPEFRDGFAAQILSHWSGKNPRAVVVALMGDFHLAQKHLPLQIKKELKTQNLKRKVLTIHQNSDSLYWKVNRKHQGKSVEVLQLKKDIFCILNTAPWIKIQSHLHWMESLASEPLDPSHEVASLLAVMAKFLGVEDPNGLPKNYEVKFDEFAKLSKLLKKDKGLLPAQAKELNRHLKDSKYLLLRDQQLLMISSSNLNHLSALTGQYLHSHLSRCSEPLGFPKKDFYSFLWVEALGYVGSKIINPKRKCKGLQDFQSSSDPIDKKVFEHIQFEKDSCYGKKRFMQSQALTSYAVAKQLGKLLGQGIFELMMRNKVSLRRVQDLFRNPMSCEGRSLYFHWVQKLDFHRAREFSFRDQL